MQTPLMDRKFLQQELTAEQLARNSKIINRKQLEKRIQGLRQEQYTKICNDLTVQNRRLKAQVKTLHQKVQQLLVSKKVSKGDKNPQVEQQILKHKRELQLKYESMNYLKEQIRKKTQVDSNDELRLRQRDFQNSLIVLEKEITALEKQKRKLSSIVRANETDMEEYNPGSQTQIVTKIDQVKHENREIKQQMAQLQDLLKKKDEDSKATLDKYYNLKERQIKSVFESKTQRKSYKNLQQLKQDSGITELKVLEKEIQHLKNMKKAAEKDLVNEKQAKEAKKTKLQKQIRESLQYHKQLFRRRVKALNQLNMYQRKDRDFHEVQSRKAHTELIQFSEYEIQTEKFYERQFRKDGVGSVTGPEFHDGKDMDFKSQSQIKSVTIFIAKESIVFVKFHYEAPGKRKLETEAPFESLILRKCESKKLTARSNGHLINMRVSLTEKRVTRLEFIWSDGQTSIQGWDADNSTRYSFDIIGDERPVAMYGSVSYEGKSMYALQSLGCEIKDSEE